MTTTFDECDIFKPRDPAIQDENEWQEFSLVNVDVCNADGAATSLLEADESSPLTLTGRIERLPQEQRQFLLERNSLPVTIKVSHILRFAYGQYDDGKLAIWAAGKVGWFKIRPSRTYKTIYRDMVQAIMTLYFVADFYREQKGKRRKPASVETVFSKYSEQPQFLCCGAEHAADLFRKHRPFLLDSMIKGKEGLNWKPTAIYEWLDQSASQEDTLSPNTTDDTSDGVGEKNPGRLAGKGKSALRPKSSKHSTKAAGRRNSITVDAEQEMPGAPRPALPPKRKHTKSRDLRPKKRANTLERQDDDTTLTSAEPDADMNAADQPLPLRSGVRRTPGKKENAILKIIESPLPSYDPQGPGDTWTCDFDGCAHKIYGASTPDSRALIKEHYRTHAFESQAQIDLVYKEERPYLPVSNLIKRIREMAAMHKVVAPRENRYPKPIQTRY